ncbi:MAG: DUF1353 domain-containing protein [Boseongicola sp.]|nr:DUF1353 domain-containing protein [Boseongicola sp.]
MKKFNHPVSRQDPYPKDWTRLDNFEFRSALSLIRPLNTVQNRVGEDGDYILQHDLLARFDIDGVTTLIRVPRGMITDLTSVPRLGRVFVSRVGPWLEAAILHDYLYIAWQDVNGLGPWERDRLFADKLFLIAMEASNVSWLRRWTIYLAVRWFGQSAYVLRNEERYVSLDDKALKGGLPFELPETRDRSDRSSRA